MNAELSNYQQTEIEKLKNCLKDTENFVRQNMPLSPINSVVSSPNISRMSSFTLTDSDVEEEQSDLGLNNYIIANEDTDAKKAFYAKCLAAKLSLSRHDPA